MTLNWKFVRPPLSTSAVPIGHWRNLHSKVSLFVTQVAPGE